MANTLYLKDLDIICSRGQRSRDKNPWRTFSIVIGRIGLCRLAVHAKANTLVNSAPLLI
jgi:hypothetical protein